MTQNGRVSALLLLAMLLVLTPLHATSTGRETVPCPVCEAEVTGTVIRSTNSFGGCDLDLCPHARGTPTIPLVIWSCPGCGFTGYQSEFTASSTIESRGRLKEWLTANLPPASYPTTAWERYDVASRLAAFRKASDEDLGDLVLRAAWCCRYAGCEHVGSEPVACWKFFENDKKACEPLDALFKEKFRALPPDMNPAVAVLDVASAAEDLYRNAPPPDPDKPAWALTFARLFRSHGEHDRALAWLDTLDRLSPPPDYRAESLAMRASIARERGFQARVVEHFERALSSGAIAENSRPPLTLIVADTLRRLGRAAEAETRLRECLAMKGLPEWIATQATASLKRLGRE